MLRFPGQAARADRQKTRRESRDCIRRAEPLLRRGRGARRAVYAVNPRLLHVEGYTINGERETIWGKGSPAVADFFGRSNPAHMAVLPDGSFVTAEIGIPRVKIYNRRGEMQTVVAGPSQLSDMPAAVAGDHRGRVLVLDARAAKVRIFAEDSLVKPGASGDGTTQRRVLKSPSPLAPG